MPRGSATARPVYPSGDTYWTPSVAVLKTVVNRLQ
jgi:hypothetical protein